MTLELIASSREPNLTLPPFFYTFSLKSFKQRLQDHGKLLIGLEYNFMTFDVPSQPESPKTEPSACETSENQSKLYSAGDLPDVVVKEGSATPDTKDAVKDISSEKGGDAPSCPVQAAAPMHGTQSEGPKVDDTNGVILKVTTEAVCQHKPKKEIKMEEENAVSLCFISALTPS